METLEMSARQILRLWEGLRLEWLLCPSNLRNQKWGLTKSKESLIEAVISVHVLFNTFIFETF